MKGLPRVVSNRNQRHGSQSLERKVMLRNRYRTLIEPSPMRVETVLHHPCVTLCRASHRKARTNSASGTDHGYRQELAASPSKSSLEVIRLRVHRRLKTSDSTFYGYWRPPLFEPALPELAILAARVLLMPLRFRASYFSLFFTCPPGMFRLLRKSCAVNALTLRYF